MKLIQKAEKINIKNNSIKIDISADADFNFGLR